LVFLGVGAKKGKDEIFGDAPSKNVVREEDESVRKKKNGGRRTEEKSQGKNRPA